MSDSPSMVQEQALAIPVTEVDRSCRTVTLYFLCKSAVWGVLGTLLLLLASVKLHAPGMMSESAWLTYGRLLPAGWSAVVYGWLGQAAMAVGCWLLARTAGQRLQAPGLVLAAGVIWNLAVLIGVVAILLGHSTGREWLEMPASVFGMLVIGGGLWGASVWMTYASRTESSPYPSAWFFLLGFLAFVWFGTAALMLLSGENLRGMVQVLVQRWAAGGFLKLWLGGLTLGMLLHLLPLLAGRPLASRPLALVTFWSLVFFTPWAVTAHGDPVPRWLVSAGVAGQMLATIGLVAVGLNLAKTVEGCWDRLWSTTAGRWMALSAMAYVLAGALSWLTTFRGAASVVRLTWWHQGMEWLWLGSLLLALLAVLPEWVDRTTGARLSGSGVSWGSLMTAVGLGLVVVPLLMAGVAHGAGLGNLDRTFMEVLRSGMMWVRLSTLGFTLMFLGQVIWLSTVMVWWLGWARERVREQVAGWSAPVGRRVEVGS